MMSACSHPRIATELHLLEGGFARWRRCADCGALLGRESDGEQDEPPAVHAGAVFRDTQKKERWSR